MQILLFLIKNTSVWFETHLTGELTISSQRREPSVDVPGSPDSSLPIARYTRKKNICPPLSLASSGVATKRQRTIDVNLKRSEPEIEGSRSSPGLEMVESEGEGKLTSSSKTIYEQI